MADTDSKEETPKIYDSIDSINRENHESPQSTRNYESNHLNNHLFRETYDGSNSSNEQ